MEGVALDSISEFSEQLLFNRIDFNLMTVAYKLPGIICKHCGYLSTVYMLIVRYIAEYSLNAALYLLYGGISLCILLEFLGSPLYCLI